MRLIVPMVLLLAFALPVAGQAPAALYMTDAAATTNGADAQLLSADEPAGGASTHQFSPATGLPADTFDWVTGAAETDDLIFTGEAAISLFFETGVDAQSTTTVTLIALASDGTERVLGSADDATPTQAVAHEETFSIDLAGKILNEGEALLLRVSVKGAAAVVQLQYGGADAKSGITALPSQILDSDGDGIGDSAERRNGTDPNDANDPSTTNATQDPSQGSSGDQTGGENGGQDGTPAAGDEPVTDDPSLEPALASLFLLICLALAGTALLRRFSI